MAHASRAIRIDAGFTRQTNLSSSDIALAAASETPPAHTYTRSFRRRISPA
jgi:hypothetical protein